MANTTPRTLLGGTFDPIHYGHLHSAIALAQQLGLNPITLLPNQLPPHRAQPIASATQRLTMLKLAIAQEPLFTLDDRELRRPSLSYTLTTLQEIRAESGPHCPLIFIIGQDCLPTLPLWHHWQRLLHYSHLLICSRPGYTCQPLSPLLKTWLHYHLIQQPELLGQHPHGFIYQLEGPQLAISSTLIRKKLQRNLNCTQYLPAAVLRYIQQQKLYLYQNGMDAEREPLSM